jgi:bifunctional DNase/RNase
MVEAVVEDIAVSGEGSHFVVLLRTGDSDILPIVIDALQAMSIAAARMGEPPERPMTHDLLLSTVELLGAKVIRVEITDLVDGTYYGMLVLERQGMRFDIDARPSDALALAVRTSCPIMIARHVLTEHALTDEDLGEGGGFEA